MYRRWLITSWPAALLGLWLFSDVLFSGRCWVFRDAGHFYLPSWSWLAEQHSRGDPAFWNPWVDLGVASLGEGSLGYWYPARALWLAPIPAAWIMKLLLLSHIVWAHLGAWRTAVRNGLGDGAAAFAATSYAFSAGVLFLVFNPPFLFGAAWLPWAMGAAGQLWQRPTLRNTALWSLPLAMMVLAGDAQTAYHTLLVAGLWCLLASRDSTTGRCLHEGFRPAACRGWIALLGGTVLAGGLSAVQVLPARRVLQASDRVVADSPRSLYAATSAVLHGGSLGDATRGVWRRPGPQGHDAAVYQYSFPPWQWLECLWPAINGRWETANSRWTTAIPAEARVWTPSVYLGLATALLAVTGACWRRPPPDRRQRGDFAILRRRATWIAALAAGAAMGVYGVGFFVEELLWGVGVRQSPVGPQVGGPYWLLTLLAPGYSWFRYPAKWLPVALWAVSLLAAAQLQRCGEQATLRTNVRRAAFLLAMASLVMAVAVCGLAPQVLLRLANTDAVDYRIFGPLDATAAMSRILQGLGHACLAAGALWLLAGRTSGVIWVRGVVLLTVVDLAVAHVGLLPSAADAVVAQRVQHPVDEGAKGDQRVLLGAADEFAFPGGVPGEDAWLLAERRLLLGRHHLAGRPPVRLLGSIQSMPPAAWSAWQAALPRRTPEERRRLSNLGLRSAAPRGQWMGRSALLPPLPVDAREAEIAARTDEVQQLLLHGQGDLAVVESPQLALTLQTQPRGEASGASVRATGFQADEIRFHVVADQPGILALAMQYAPGWSVSIESGWERRDAMQPLRVNRVLMGVALPAGEWTVVFRYRPPGAVLGAWITLLSWLAVAWVLLRREPAIDPEQNGPRRTGL